MSKIKLRRIGNSIGLLLPAHLLRRMNVSDGDELHVLEMQDGIILSPFDPEFEAQMKAAQGVMKRRRDALRELAR